MSTKGKRDFRPSYHFTPKKMWINDPNGMVFENGNWHLFYQYNPDSTYPGPMHWGHAVSKNLVDWEHLPIALAPDELGLVFSGSAICDTQNQSGFFQHPSSGIVAMYTSHGTYEQQCIAYSQDGVHFEKYAGNPVIPNTEKKDFRDPKLFWNKKRNCYGMILAAGDRVEFYASQNLKSWEKTGEFTHTDSWCQGGYIWECPDLFLLPVLSQNNSSIGQHLSNESTQAGQKWVLLVSINAPKEGRGSSTWYFVGEFDGNTFHPDGDGQPRLMDYGYDNYAAVTWAGRNDRIVLGWASNWLYAGQLPTGEFCGQMTFARKLMLEKESNGWCLYQKPVLDQTSMPKLLELEWDWQTGATGCLRKELTSEVCHLQVVKRSDENETARNVRSLRFVNTLGQYLEIGIQNDGCVYVDRSHTLPAGEPFDDIFACDNFSRAVSSPLSGDSLDLDIYWDHSILEVFADNGRIVLTMLAYPDEPYTYVETGCCHTLKQSRIDTPTQQALPRLAIFDMDGLMFDTEELCFCCMKEVLQAKGYELTRQLYIRTIGCNSRRVQEIYTGLFGENFPMEEVSKETYMKMFEVIDKKGVPIKKGLPELLSYLKTAGIPCVIASSSSNSVIEHYLKQSNLRSYFSHIVDGNQTTRSKPEPDIFLKACHDCDVNPKDALVLEDSHNGILAAWHAGIPVICVPDMVYPAPEYASKTTQICQSLLDVLELLR